MHNIQLWSHFSFDSLVVAVLVYQRYFMGPLSDLKGVLTVSDSASADSASSIHHCHVFLLSTSELQEEVQVIPGLCCEGDIVGQVGGRCQLACLSVCFGRDFYSE